jgi:hypothetical protein
MFCGARTGSERPERGLISHASIGPRARLGSVPPQDAVRGGGQGCQCPSGFPALAGDRPWDRRDSRLAHRLRSPGRMSVPREVLPGSFYMLTRRCTSGSSCCALRFEIEIILPSALFNHHHTVLFDRHGRVIEFTEHFHRCSPRRRTRTAAGGRTCGRPSRPACCAWSSPPMSSTRSSMPRPLGVNGLCAAGPAPDRRAAADPVLPRWRQDAGGGRARAGDPARARHP